MVDLPSSKEINEKRILFDGREQAKELILSLAKNAHRQICILGRNIDQTLFDNTDFINYASELARRSPTTEIKIIVRETLSNVQHGHRLIPLAQRLTSSVHVRNTAKQHHNLQQTLLIIDDYGYLICPLYSRYEGRCSFDDRLETRNLQHLFDQVWDAGTPDLTIRRLFG